MQPALPPHHEAWSRKQYSVEEGFDICAEFFCDLWPSFKTEIAQTLSAEGLSAYELFVETICAIRVDGYADWNEAIKRYLHVPKNNQFDLVLSEGELFFSTMEFCKIYNERFFGAIARLLKLIEAMYAHPKQHVLEWSIWSNTIQKCLSFDLHPFDWDTEME